MRDAVFELYIKHIINYFNISRIIESINFFLKLLVIILNDQMKYTVTKLDAVADANSLIQLAIAAWELQGLEPMDLLFDCEFQLHYSE